MSFGERLRDLRAFKNLTQQELADMIGVNRATIAGYETKGKEPPYQTLIKLARALNCSVDYLLGNAALPDNVGNADGTKTDNHKINYCNRISQREDLQRLFEKTENLSSNSVNRIIDIIEIINDEVNERSNAKKNPLYNIKENESPKKL